MVKLVLEPGSLAEGQQQLKLSPSTAGLRSSLTAGNYSFSTFSVTGRWKTRFTSWRFSCFLLLAESHTRFAGILPSSSPLWDRFFVSSEPACHCHQKHMLVMAAVMSLLWWSFSAPSFSRCEERMLSKEITSLQQNQ